MQAALRRSLFVPLHYWRTIFLVLAIGISVTVLFRDGTALLLSTLASAFVFSAYERRRWIVMPAELLVRDIGFRLGLAFAATYVLSSTQMGPLFA